MLSADLLCAVWQSGLVLAAALGGPVVLALALSALTAISSVVYSPAVSATIPSLVGEDESWPPTRSTARSRTWS